ncbi:MAG: site-specific integrase [Syntrophales bacterium]
MITQEAIKLFRDYLRLNHRKRTIESYGPLLEKYEAAYSQKVLDSIGSDEIYDFLETVTQHLSKSTRRLRYAQMKAFYNFIIDRCSLNMKNPCNTPLLRKSYRAPKQLPHKILEREIVDEMIYCTRRQRDRLILELQARCGLRIGELLKIKVSDISDRTITLREPKSGKDAELAYMPDSVSKKLAEYIKDKGLQSDDRPFPICYSTARTLVRWLGEKVKVRISPHDLRRYSATFASRNGVPLEVVSKIILRHQDLKTTQVYLGKVSDTEAIRWVDILHGK